MVVIGVDDSRLQADSVGTHSALWHSCYLPTYLQDSVVVVYLFQQSKQNIGLQFQHNKFNKSRQPEGQMPVMLATYSTNKVIVSETICNGTMCAL